MANLEEHMLPCINKKLFGIECMGCGIQRSIALILKGEFLDAFFMYPAIYTLILMFGLILINLFKNFNSYSKVISALAIVNLLIIITNFTIKLL